MPAKTKAATSTAAASLPEPRAGIPIMPKSYGLKARKKYLPWSHTRERLEVARNYWVASASAQGRPHAMPVWGFWIRDRFYFGTSRETRKWRNLAQNPAVIIHLESADDVVVVEGVAVEISLAEAAAMLKAASQEKYGMWMPPQPEHVYVAVRPRVAIAWTHDSFPTTATRWVFE